MKLMQIISSELSQTLSHTYNVTALEHSFQNKAFYYLLHCFSPASQYTVIFSSNNFSIFS